MSGYPYLDDLTGQARDRPDGLALVLPDRQVTWRELDVEAIGYARRHAADPSGGDQAVELPLPPGEEAVIALHALPRIGRHLVALDPASGDPTGDPTEAKRSDHDVVWVESQPDGIRTGVFTSGSSGEPRLVPLTFANHLAAAEAARQLFELTPDDRWLACLPFHHIGGLSVFTRSAHVGFTTVVVWPFGAAAVIEAAERHRATAVSLVPTMLRRLLDAGWKPPASLRFVLLGGAACPPAIQWEALDRGIPIAPSFGMTETCSQFCTLMPEEVEAHFGTVGRPIPGAAVEVRGADGLPLPHGEVGRIWVKGGMVARSPQMRAGWLETGDLGSLGRDGYLTVAGRADDMMVSGGENVAPSEIEELLMMREDVAEAVVVGIADHEWGQRVVAAVVPARDDHPDPEELRGYLAENLAPFKIPKHIAVLAELPHIGPGKVDRNMLRELISETLQAGDQ